MPSLKNLFLILSIVILTIIAEELAIVTSAEAVTINFQWTGQTGYFAEGSFSYDEQIAPKIISEKGSGKTNILQSFEISFFYFSSEPIATYEDIVNGVSKANYFAFNYNPVMQQVFGLIDIGGELPGEAYLKGKVHNNLSLVRAGKSGYDITIDANSGSLITSLQLKN